MLPDLNWNLCALHSPPLREPDSPLASREHLALHNLAKHLEAPLQFTGAHVTGEISNVHHAAFTLPKGDTEGPVIIAWLPGAPLVAVSRGVLVPSPHHLAKQATPAGAGVRERTTTVAIPEDLPCERRGLFSIGWGSGPKGSSCLLEGNEQRLGGDGRGNHHY